MESFLVIKFKYLIPLRLYCKNSYVGHFNIQCLSQALKLLRTTQSMLEHSQVLGMVYHSLWFNRRTKNVSWKPFSWHCCAKRLYQIIHARCTQHIALKPVQSDRLRLSHVIVLFSVCIFLSRAQFLFTICQLMQQQVLNTPMT